MLLVTPLRSGQADCVVQDGDLLVFAKPSTETDRGNSVYTIAGDLNGFVFEPEDRQGDVLV